ncbi:MAG: methyltransferase domain-containing protein [Phenylobacterium sp.]|uniref:methyltransferase domain-containing protein n=1 Tax=Phenylobacterium sp. TaxID=1871053 RepID=UPI0025E3B95A|nr:methyltransferase domain-containing protein [Phenylobacterium sp.]MBI1199980.1 methyltransferase domain-containing protein [Phenylobacterium sp.]
MARASSADKRPGWHWSDYWRAGRVEVMTGAGGEGAAPYDPEPLWRAFFETFEDGARLIDLATGGGSVARLAAAVSREAGRGFEVVGVDYADLGPSEGRSDEGFTLTGGVALEKLPFEAGSFDGATSQFGIEYADVRAALAELARVLKPGGRALILAHHAQSAVTRAAAGQLAGFDQVVGDGAGMRHARRAFAAHANGLPLGARRDAEAAFAQAVQRMAARLAPDPAFDHVRAFVGYLDDLSRNMARYEPRSALARLDHAAETNAAWRQRQRSQLAAALDDAGAEAFLARATRLGLSVEPKAEERDRRGEVVGWRLALRKA